MTIHDDADIRTAVRERYAAAATSASCCGPASCGTAFIDAIDPFRLSQYGDDERALLPEEALVASLGCGNPTMLAELNPGDVVLDLGSGGGIDVLLSARRVAPGGKAYGLDMTPEMLELANANRVKSGIENVEFLLGSIEDVPLPDASVDVIISNCVVNLSPDKDRVFRESFRVLAPGGRFAISDMVLSRPLPSDVASVMALWTGCIAGALTEDQVLAGLEGAGFSDVTLEPTTVFGREELEGLARILSDITWQVAAPPVRMVKTIGDAVMLVSPDPGALLDTVFTLMEAAEAQSGFPRLKVGMAVGQAVSRAGDWFGSPVNLASRVTSVTRPGAVLLTQSAFEAVGDDPRFSWSDAGDRKFKGIASEVQLFRARRAEPGDTPMKGDRRSKTPKAK